MTSISQSPATPVTAVERSANAKIGDVSATYLSQASCPKDCPLLGKTPEGKLKGCYAQSGPIGIVTARLNESDETGAENLARFEARAIDGLSGKRTLRLHVVGDARTDRAASLLGKAAGRYAQRGMMPRRGKKVWTYTHAWVAKKTGALRVKRSSWGKDVSVLASCETTAEAKQAMRAGYAAALVVSEFRQSSAYQQDGITVLPCPAQTREHVTCESCGLCRDDDRLRKAGMVIAFAVHGSAKRAVARTLASLDVL